MDNEEYVEFELGLKPSLETSGRVTYIASPVAKFYEEARGDLNIAADNAIKHAERVAQIAMERFGIIPVSVPMMFLRLYDELTQRQEAFNGCLEILKRCDAFFYLEEDLVTSEGMQKERELAEQWGKIILSL